MSGTGRGSRFRLGLLSLAGAAALGLRCGSVAHEVGAGAFIVCAVIGSVRCRSVTGCGAIAFELEDRGADFDGLAFLYQQLGDHTGVRAGQFDERFSGFDFDEDLVDRDGVARGDLPRNDVSFGQPLARVGQEKCVCHWVP